jgi:hypothetical protein
MKYYKHSIESVASGLFSVHFKVVNCVNHSILMTKLIYYGILVVNDISYLTNKELQYNLKIVMIISVLTWIKFNIEFLKTQYLVSSSFVC